MKKIVLAAAVAAAIPAFAQADVNLYGSLRAGVSVTKNSTNNYSSTFGVDDFGSVSASAATKIWQRPENHLASGNRLRHGWRLRRRHRVRHLRQP